MTHDRTHNRRNIRTILLLLPYLARGCTNILVTKGAAHDGTNHLAYNADDAAMLGAVSHWPAATHAPTQQRPVYSWDLGIYLGSIDQPPRTYNVMGNANCQGLVISETTHGGRKELSNVGKTHLNGTVLDYGSLIYVTLSRAATAREAIRTMAALVEQYGYASDMEGFSIADADEVWYMEFIAKGGFEKGAVWVALRVPDGHITAHANQARITTFLPCDDADKCMMAPDVVTFAKKRGYWSGSATDVSFSFSDTYDPVTFGGARWCEARVWYVFSQLADPRDFDPQEHLAYAQGRQLTKRMPLFVRPKQQLTRELIHKVMGSHFDASWFDPAIDVGAAAEHSPYRWNGLKWEHGASQYVNERVVGVQYTGWHFVATIRKAVPRPMRAVLWWGADDHSFAPKIPIHGGAARVDVSYDDANCTARAACRAAAKLPGSVLDFSWDSSWWVNNAVADLAYTRMDRAAPTVLAAREALEAELETQLRATDAAAAAAFQKGDDALGRRLLDEHSVSVGQKATARWQELWKELMVSFIDGRVTKRNEKNEVCGCDKDAATFTDAWKAKVVEDTGDKYLIPPSVQLDEQLSVVAYRLGSPTLAQAGRTVDKLSIKGV